LGTSYSRGKTNILSCIVDVHDFIFSPYLQ
jgi:hypothetical protein